VASSIDNINPMHLLNGTNQILKATMGSTPSPNHINRGKFFPPTASSPPSSNSISPDKDTLTEMDISSTP